jgi:peptide/nickel transport system permease protein
MLAATERFSSRRLPLALTFGAGLLVLIAGASFVASYVATFRFDAMDVMARLHPPDAVHWLGTDEFGRDVLGRVLRGGLTSIGLGVAATALAFAIGVPLGLLGGYTDISSVSTTCPICGCPVIVSR